MTELTADKLMQEDAEAHTAALVELLSRPQTYPDRPRQVTMIETHISRVFLTDRYAYKLKKPVRFDFLDFSTAELRYEACRNELTLNRRLAPQVYLDVVPITASRRRLRLAGEGPTVDWLVKMRRLPAERSLDHLLQRQLLTDTEVDKIAETLANFYRELPPLSLHTELYRQHIEGHVQGNRRELLNPAHGFGPQLVKRIHAAQLRVLRLNPELFDDRVRDGRIVDGHGDLRPEHVYLTQPPAIIDCIEFNQEFRQLDVLDELSFLAVECARLGDKSVGGRILQQYCQTSGDLPPEELLPFYLGYRACVRAKVQALRSDQLVEPESTAAIEGANEYLRLADHYAAEVGPPLVIVVRGLTGTGKSTLADALADAMGLEGLHTDNLRREMFGPSPTPAEYDSEHYRPRNRARVYDEMFHRAGDLLSARHSLVLDGTFLNAKTRSLAASLARRHGAVPVILCCRCPDQTAAERIEARQDDVSESRPELVLRQREQDDADPPGVTSLAVDTTASIPAMLEQVFRHIRTSLAGHVA